MSRFFGIDLHLDSIQVAVLGDGDSDAQHFKFSLKTSAFEKFLSMLTGEDYLAVEASTNTFWFISQIEHRVRGYFVLEPYKFSIIGNSLKKTDRIDALKIAKKLKYYVTFDQSADEFPTVYIPPKEVQELRSLFSTYEGIKKQAIMTKNRIRSLFRQNGIFEFSKQNLSYTVIQESVLSELESHALHPHIKILIDLLNFQEKQKDEIKREILRKGKIFYNEIKLLTSIRGVSPFLAIAIMSDIVTIDRFPNAKHLSSYLRTAPRINASGEKSQVGKVNKHSRTLTISLMTESVKHFIDSSERLHEYYFKKRNSKSAGKVRVAVMRKIIVIIYKMLTKNEMYYFRDEKNHDAKIIHYDNIIKKIA